MIFIKNTTLVTQNPKREILFKAGLIIQGKQIKEIGPSHSLAAKYKKEIKQVIDGKGKVVMPGLINAHGHLAMTLLRGYADDISLEEWWTKYVYPVESKFKAEHVYWGSLLAMLEMIKSGTTCFVDFYYFEDQVAKAAQEIGMRGVLGSAILDLPTFYFKTPTQALKKAEQIAKQKTNNLLDFTFAPHMLQTTSLKTYLNSKKLADKYQAILSTHLSETKAEVDYSLKEYKLRPAELLFKNNLLNERSLLTHACWLNNNEIKLISKTKASLVHCPASNMKLASGVMPLPELFKQQVNLCLGTDSACSNNNLDMFEEMKLAALLHKLNSKNPQVAQAQQVLDMATINGAKALGKQNLLGSLEPGKLADLIMLDFEKSHLVPAHNIISCLVYSAQGSDVETVLINGKIVMLRNKIKKINQSIILKKIKKVALFNNN